MIPYILVGLFCFYIRSLSFRTRAVEDVSAGDDTIQLACAHSCTLVFSPHVYIHIPSIFTRYIMEEMTPGSWHAPTRVLPPRTSPCMPWKKNVKKINQKKIHAPTCLPPLRTLPRVPMFKKCKKNVNVFLSKNWEGLRGIQEGLGFRV